MKKFFMVIMVLLAGVAAHAKTLYSGDIVDGKKVITNLDVEDLKKGEVHEFYFKTVENNIGQSWYVPVTVVKGKKNGPKFLLNSGVHGNEVNPILTTHKVKELLDPKEIKGTVTIVHGFNVTGLINNTREFKASGKGNTYVDLNRQMNTEKQVNTDQMYVNKLWNHLLLPNAEYAIDLHTAGAGSGFPLFIYADYRVDEVAKMAGKLGADVVKMDNGEKGSVETSFVEKGIPALTFELGTGSVYEKDIVERAVSGIENYMKEIGIVAGESVVKEAKFTGNKWERIRSEKGGFVETQVELMQEVKKGEVIAIQYDTFGMKVAEYKAPVDGLVASLKKYPLSEPGESLGRIIYYTDEDEDQKL